MPLRAEEDRYQRTKEGEVKTELNQFLLYHPDLNDLTKQNYKTNNFAEICHISFSDPLCRLLLDQHVLGPNQHVAVGSGPGSPRDPFRPLHTSALRVATAAPAPPSLRPKNPTGASLPAQEPRQSLLPRWEDVCVMLI